ncbi:MAG: inositol monophosphatase family protein, partial [Mariprofundus sp.]
MTSIRVETVAEVLEQTGREIILPAYKASVQTISKSDGSVVTEIDLACQHFIEQELAGIDASVALLGEEMEESEQLACLNRQGSFWCLDPLDGTTNFATSFP